MTDKIVVAFATDHKFRYFTGVALFTLIEHASEKTNYEILILADSLSEADSHIFFRLVEEKKNFSLRIIDMKEKITKINIKKLQLCGSYASTAILHRLFLHELLPEYDKVLYLDSDIIIQSDIKELYCTDLKKYPIGAVRDPLAKIFSFSVYDQRNFLYLKKTLKIKNTANYFNSGVLLLDLIKLRHADFSSQVRCDIELADEYKYPDQDILNRIFYNNVHYLDKKWNFITRTKRNPAAQKIIHFASVHPWLSIMKPSASHWWRAAEKTFFIEDMKKELALSPDKIRYWQHTEKAYYDTLESTCWRMTAWLRSLFNIFKWVKFLFTETLKRG